MIKTPKFIGDLSEADAAVLTKYAQAARYILEFGAGGSTQIFVQASHPQARITSVETDPKWITITKQRLRRLSARARCEFANYTTWLVKPRPTSCDLVFVDGAWPLRRKFAVAAWPLLRENGVMLFHDTRRAKDVANVAALITHKFEEIGEVLLNEQVNGATSNITVVKKKRREPYVNWKRSEKKPIWKYGEGDVPEEFWSHG